MSEVVTTLGVLRCSLRAAKEINLVFGSYGAAYKRITEYDFGAYIAIVAAGLGKSGKEVEVDVYNVGMPDLVRPLTDFLGLLSNGGRPPSLDGTEGTTAGATAGER